MLVARQCDIGRNPWFSSNLEALYSTEPLRMPDADLLPTRPDWRDQYSSLALPQEQSSGSPHISSCSFSNECLIMVEQDGSRSILEQHQTNLAKSSEISQIDAMVDRLQWNPGDVSSPCKSTDQSHSILCQEPTSVSLEPVDLNQLNSASRDSGLPGKAQNDGDVEDPELDVKNEEEELDDDDDEDMIDVELEEELLPKSEAERRAERRKMKRFR